MVIKVVCKNIHGNKRNQTNTMCVQYAGSATKTTTRFNTLQPTHASEAGID